MKRHEKDPLAGLHPPRAPEALRRRVLRAAAEAMEAPEATVWEKIWESRRARLALAASLAALIAGHVILGAVTSAPAGPTQRARIATPAQEPEVVAVAVLPRIRLEPTPFE